MAVVKNVAGEARNIPLAGGIVEDGDTFEVDDDVFAHFDWPEELFKVTTPPAKKAAKKAADSADNGEKE